MRDGDAAGRERHEYVGRSDRRCEAIVGTDHRPCALPDRHPVHLRHAAGREPGTETTVPPLTPLAELLEALRANADDEINRTLDNGAAAAGYRNALHLVEYFAPKIESEAVRRGARIGRRVRGSEAEARQQGRDRGLREAVERLLVSRR